MPKALRVLFLLLLAALQVVAVPVSALVTCVDEDGCCDGVTGCHCVPCHVARDVVPSVSSTALPGAVLVSTIAPDVGSPALPSRASDILHIPIPASA